MLAQFQYTLPIPWRNQEKEERRALGLVLLRGECVVSVAVESAPAANKGKRSATAAGLPPGPDRVPAGRGTLEAPPGLAGPAPGLGVPNLAAIQPQLSADPRMYTNAYGRGVVVPPAPVGPLHVPMGIPPLPAGTAPVPTAGAPYGRGAGSGSVPPPYGGHGMPVRRGQPDDAQH